MTSTSERWSTGVSATRPPPELRAPSSVPEIHMLRNRPLSRSRRLTGIWVTDQTRVV